MPSPNILVIMTDEERSPPPYEGEPLARFRREQLGACGSIRDGGLEFHRHYAGSTACLPSRTTLFTGQYPSLHGATNTDGMAKKANDPAMQWLDPNSVPTLGDWFRAGGYETHYRGKWHISHADLLIPGADEGLKASDDAGNPVPEVVAAYKGADRLDPYGFSGWVGREPHGADKSDCGVVRDGVFAEQACQEAFVKAWPTMLYEQSADEAYRRLYYYLHKLVDRAIGRILDALEHSGMADDTVVVFTSDHGDLVGAHGGLMQKWYNVYDEAMRVPLLVRGPGIDVERAAALVAVEHDETQTLPGRDLSPVLRGTADAATLAEPLYFMTEDDVGRGLSRLGMASGKEYETVPYPSHVESVITALPTGAGDTSELWKLNHYYERLDAFDQEHGLPVNPFAPPPAEPAWELHNLTADPEERSNRAGDTPGVLGAMQSVLHAQREAKRRLPQLRNSPA